MIKNLDEKATRKLLKEQKLGHLGCVLDSGEPYVIPVNYLFKADGIYVHVLPGQKLDAMRANGKICLQVDKIEDSCRRAAARLAADTRRYLRGAIKSQNRLRLRDGLMLAIKAFCLRGWRGRRKQPV